MKPLIYISASAIIISTIAACGIRSKSQLKDESLEESIKPISARNGEFEECGVKHIKTGTDPDICGYNYKIMSSPNCPTIGYYGRDSSCGWNRAPQSSGWVRWNQCEGDWKFVESRTVKEWRDCPGDKTCLETIKEIHCRFDGEAKECQHSNSSNGSPVYAECESPNHPIASVKTCSNEAFGKVYHSCSIYLDRSQLSLWIEDRKTSIPSSGQHLITHQANYYGAISDEQNFACVITKFGQDPLYTDLITSLKTRYFTIFANEYDEKKFDCSKPSIKPTIENSTCSKESNTLECRTVRAYRLAKKTLEVAGVDAQNLLNSPTVQSSNSDLFKKEITELQILIERLTVKNN